MKTLTLLFLVACASAFAQTNFGTITFTNKDGIIISNAEVVRVEVNKLIWRLGAGGGSIKLTDLPNDVRARFGYDAARASQQDVVEREKRERLAKQDAAAAAKMRAVQAEQAAFKKRADEFFSSQEMIQGEVTQRHEKGITVLVTKPWEQRIEIWEGWATNCAVGQYVQLFGYKPKRAYVKLLNGAEEGRIGYSTTLPQEFQNDPRAIFPKAGKETEEWEARKRRDQAAVEEARQAQKRREQSK